MPFIWTHCRSGQPIATMGASLGAFHAANTLFRYPHLVKRCYALSGIYDLRRMMDGGYDENFYFHNPVDYLSNLGDPWYFEQFASCEIRLATGSPGWDDLPFRALATVRESVRVAELQVFSGPAGAQLSTQPIELDHFSRQPRRFARATRCT